MKCNLCLVLIFTQMFWLLIVFTAFADDPLVYQIDIRNEIGNGLRVYIEKGIKEAELNQASAIIFDVHTPVSYTHLRAHETLRYLGWRRVL